MGNVIYETQLPGVIDIKQASMNHVSDLRNSPRSIQYPKWRIFLKISSAISNDAIQLYYDNEISNDIDIYFQTDDQCVVLFTSETNTWLISEEFTYV